VASQRSGSSPREDETQLLKSCARQTKHCNKDAQDQDP